MLLLCSDGLTSDSLMRRIASRTSGGAAALVVTADHAYKERNYHIPRCKDELASLGFDSALFDIDVQPPEELLQYDAVEFIGGNPYYLLKSLREHNCKKVLSVLAEEKMLIAWSAGALVMGPTIAMIDQYSPEMNQWHITDYTGMNLTEVQVLPQYSKFLKRYNRLEELCREYERNNQCTVIRMNDGEGVLIEHGEATVIRA